MSAEPKINIFGKIVRVFIALAFLAGGGLAYAYLKNSAPKVRRQQPKPMPTVVNVIKAAPSSTKAVISGMGTVIAARQITLESRVAGEVIQISPNLTPGGKVKKGEVLLRLDPADYEVEVQKAQSSLDKARADYDIEVGYQQVAKDELRLMTKSSKMPIDNTALALRKPQLNKEKANVASAEADLKKALLNLSRTVIKAPFNALIIERDVNLGSQVGGQEKLATLVGTDEYWIEAALPLDKLPRLNGSGGGGAAVKVSSHSGGHAWQGRTLRLSGTLNENSRMAKILIAVPDPFALHSEKAGRPLILGDYVSVEIQGGEINDAIELPRSALRDNNSVWLLNKAQLEIRKVDLAWKEKERVFIDSGLHAGDKVITSELSAPVEGMRLVSSEMAKKMMNAKSGSKTAAGPGMAQAGGAGMGSGSPKQGKKKAGMKQAQGKVPDPAKSGGQQ